MRGMHRAFVAVVVSLLGIGRAQDSAPSRPADNVPGMREAFELLDRLGIPDTTNFRFVEVKRLQRGRSDPQSAFGFLTQESPTTFTVWLVDLQLKEFRHGPGTSYAAAELSTHAKQVIESTVNSPHHIDWNPLGMRSYLISLARELSRRGENDLARACCSTAASLRPLRGGGRLGDGTLSGTIREEVDTAWIWRATLACGDREVDRGELLENFRQYLRSFPEGRFVKEARDMAQQLERMVQEDLAHQQDSRPFRTMSQAVRVEELIYRLRDEKGFQLTVPGHASSMAAARTESPAWQLVAMGHAAVPKLIEAIGDRRLTRTVGCWRDFVFSHYVVRVGDCAVEILEQIAGRRFWTETTTHSYVLKDGLENEVRAEVISWWEQVRASSAQSRAAESRAAPR
jgi:hypothetical protein